MTTPTTYIEGMVIFKQTWTVHFFRNHSLRTINTSQGAVRVIASETLPSMTRSTAFSPVAPVNIKSISYFFAISFGIFDEDCRIPRPLLLVRRRLVLLLLDALQATSSRTFQLLIKSLDYNAQSLRMFDNQQRELQPIVHQLLWQSASLMEGFLPIFGTIYSNKNIVIVFQHVHLSLTFL